METLSFETILAATDYTELSENAVRTASLMCRKHNAALILVHVVESAAVPYDEHHFDLDYTKELKKAAGNQLKRLADDIRSNYRIPVTDMVRYGDVAGEILRVVKEHKPGLVVIGTHGTSGVRRFFIGSTAYRIIRSSGSPVMTVPGTGDWSSFTHILFPVISNSRALEKYDLVSPIIRKDHSKLHVLGLSMEADFRKLNEVKEIGKKLEERLHGDGVAYDAVYDRCHHYADSILETAEQKQATLIVITANVESDFRAFFIGPFAQQIINHAKVPVLCIMSQ